MKFSVLSALVLIVFSGNSAALTHCNDVTVNNIQVTDDRVEVKAGNIWHFVDGTANPTLDKKLSVLLSAFAANKQVQLIFEADNYPCNTETLSSRMYGVRILE